MGGRGVPGARRLTSADLQLLILALLAERPAHGYELIKLLEERSGGFYSPSPGMIYPALTYLDEIGHALVEPEGTRKLYRITEAGTAHLEAHRATADSILAMLARIGGRMEQVRDAFAGVNDPDPGPSEALHRARVMLKQALLNQRGCNAKEALRIAAILDQATAAILAHTPGAHTPGAQTPGAQTPGAQTPCAQTPGAQTPCAQTPCAQTPCAQTPGAQTPGAQTRDQ